MEKHLEEAWDNWAFYQVFKSEPLITQGLERKKIIDEFTQKILDGKIVTPNYLTDSSKWYIKQKKEGKMVGTQVVMFFGMFAFVVAFMINQDTIQKRIYPNGNDQPLVTRCQVKDYIPEAPKGPEKFNGYIYQNGDKLQCDILETHKDELKIRIFVESPNGGTFARINRWISKKEFHKNHTIEELSEMHNSINKTRKKK